MAMTAQVPRAFPAITAANRHFWCGGADGRLHILRCADGHWIHPYAARCPTCGSAEIAPEPVSGYGQVAGFTANHQPWLPGIEVPYIVAIVELAEQQDIRLMTNMPRTPIGQVHIGMKVKVFFDQYGEIFVPLFEAA
jgi:uncharacterized OB-fold protein